MIKTRTRIISVTDGTAWVRPSEDSGCGGCGSRSSCAISGLGKYFGHRARPVAVPCDSGARPGDELVVSTSEAQLLKAGLMAYLLPSVLGITGAAVGAMNGMGNPGAVAGMVSGVALGLLIARLLARKPHLGTKSLTTSRGNST